MILENQKSINKIVNFLSDIYLLVLIKFYDFKLLEFLLAMPGLLISVANSVPIVAPLTILSIEYVATDVATKIGRVSDGYREVSIDTPIPLLRLGLV